MTTENVKVLTTDQVPAMGTDQPPAMGTDQPPAMDVLNLSELNGTAIVGTSKADDVVEKPTVKPSATPKPTQVPTPTPAPTPMPTSAPVPNPVVTPAPTETPAPVASVAAVVETETSKPINIGEVRPADDATGHHEEAPAKKFGRLTRAMANSGMTPKLWSLMAKFVAVIVLGFIFWLFFQQSDRIQAVDKKADNAVAIATETQGQMKTVQGQVQQLATAFGKMASETTASLVNISKAVADESDNRVKAVELMNKKIDNNNRRVIAAAKATVKKEAVIHEEIIPSQVSARSQVREVSVEDKTADRVETYPCSVSLNGEVIKGFPTKE